MVDLLNLLLGGLHIFLVAIWIGGSFFSSHIFKPSLLKIPPKDRGTLLTAVGEKFTVYAQIAIVGLLATGIIRAWMLGYLTNDFIIINPILNVKILLVAGMIISGTVNGSVIKPRLFDLVAKSAKAPDNLHIQKRIHGLQSKQKINTYLTQALGIAVIFLAVSLRFGYIQI